MSRQSVADFLKNIDERIAALDAERGQLTALRRMYVGDGDSISHERPSAPRLPPVPEERKVKLVKNSSGQTGTTPLILAVVKEYPGIEQIHLTNRVMEHVLPGSDVTRPNLRDQIRYLVEKGKLIKRGMSLYLPEVEAEGKLDL